MRSLKAINALALFICFFAFASVFLIEYRYGITPCQLCLLQRAVFLLIILVLMLRLLHPLRPKNCISYGVVLLLLAALGMLLATRQLWLEAHPANTGICVPGLDSALQKLSWGEWLRHALTSHGDCGIVYWRFLHLSLAGWSLLAFGLIAGLALLQFFYYKKLRSRQNAYRFHYKR